MERANIQRMEQEICREQLLAHICESLIFDRSFADMSETVD
jgi:hypothetical protein